MNPPSLDEQIAAIGNQIETLVNSFTILIGPDKGQITEPGIEREIECLRAAIESLERLKTYGDPEDDRPHW